MAPPVRAGALFGGVAISLMSEISHQEIASAKTASQ